MICNKHNKKSGSTILLILTISMVVTLLCGTMLSAMLFTMKGNGIEKKNDDLLYAAEGGFELGRALVAKDIIYCNSVGDLVAQGYINSQALKLSTNTVHSVDITTQEIITANRVKVKSIAYGYDGTGNKNVDDKIVVEKVIERTNIPGVPPSSGNIFQNSMVANGTIEIDTMGSGDLGTTQITAGGGIPSIKPGVIPPTIKNDVIESPIFKPVANPKIKKQTGTVTANYVSGTGHGVSLRDQATILRDDGSTSVDNGIGRLVINDRNIGTSMGAYYEVILVNADKLLIKPQDRQSLNETKTIVICSGDIEIEVNEGTNTITRSTFFGRKVKATKPGAISIFNAPANGTTTDDLSSEQLTAIDNVLKEYIENWGGAASPGGPGGSGGGTTENWEEIESETVYE